MPVWFRRLSLGFLAHYVHMLTNNLLLILFYINQAQGAIDSGVPTQVSYGFISGYCSGIALKKVGRAAAVVFGKNFSPFLLLFAPWHCRRKRRYEEVEFLTHHLISPFYPWRPRICYPPNTELQRIPKRRSCEDSEGGRGHVRSQPRRKSRYGRREDCLLKGFVCSPVQPSIGIGLCCWICGRSSIWII